MSLKNQMFSSFDTSFCDGCGALLPPMPPVGDVKCLACKKSIPIENFTEVETSYKVVFNKVNDYIDES